MTVAASVRWIGLTQAVRFASQMLSLIVLARLLPADAYGLMAMAMTVTNLAFLFRDLGTMVAIIQRPHLSESLKSSLYWLNLGLALLLALLLAALALPLAAAYREARLAALLAVLALVFPLSGLAAVQQALLERASRFRLLARIETVSALGGVAVALTAAACDAGVWSLVLQMLAATGLASLQLLRASPWRPRRRCTWRALRQVLDFSGHFAAFQMLNYVQRNADSMLIGRLLGPMLLGVYAMAFKVVLFPLQHISNVASRALLPAMSRCQHDPGRLAEMYLRASGMMALLTAPLMTGLYALREPFVLLMLGPAWSTVGTLVPWLAALGLIQAQATIPASVLLARGRARGMLGLGLFGAALQLAGFAVALRWGLSGIAAAYCLSSLLALLPLTRCALDGLPLRLGALLAEVGKPLAAALVMLVAVMALHQRLAARGAGMAAAFWLCVAAGALVYLGMLLAMRVRQLDGLLALRGARP
jgi:PST family polysaccharide transporter